MPSFKLVQEKKRSTFEFVVGDHRLEGDAAHFAILRALKPLHAERGRGFTVHTRCDPNDQTRLTVSVLPDQVPGEPSPRLRPGQINRLRAALLAKGYSEHAPSETAPEDDLRPQHSFVGPPR